MPESKNKHSQEELTYSKKYGHPQKRRVICILEARLEGMLPIAVTANRSIQQALKAALEKLKKIA